MGEAFLECEADRRVQFAGALNVVSVLKIAYPQNYKVLLPAATFPTA